MANKKLDLKAFIAPFIIQYYLTLKILPSKLESINLFIRNYAYYKTY